MQGFTYCCVTGQCESFWDPCSFYLKVQPSIAHGLQVCKTERERSIAHERFYRSGLEVSYNSSANIPLTINQSHDFILTAKGL